jgi:hypothetical protein
MGVGLQGLAFAGPAFDPRLCKDVHRVSREMVQYHLAGAHWQGGVSHCLDQRNFKTILSEHQSVGDSSLITPAFIVPKGATVRIDSETEVDIGGVEVRFTFPAVKGGESTELHDSLIYIWNGRKQQKRDGCASIETLPAYFAVREECLK